MVMLVDKFIRHLETGMIAAVKAGLGVMVLPKSMVPHEIKYF